MNYIANENPMKAFLVFTFDTYRVKRSLKCLCPYRTADRDRRERDALRSFHGDRARRLRGTAEAARSVTSFCFRQCA